MGSQQEKVVYGSPSTFLILASLNSCQQLLTPPNEVVPQDPMCQSMYASQHD